MNFNYDFTVKDVSDAYNGEVGILWEVLMGEHIHVGGEKETRRLAIKLGIQKGNYVLDVCSALGGPARYIASQFEANVIGVDITETMIKKAIERTKEAELQDQVEFRRGNVLDLPIKRDSMDFVWGQDAWCYVTSKKRLIEEVVRVCKPGGKIGFTDWILGNARLPTDFANKLFAFMIFPNMETLEGYKSLLKTNQCKIIEVENLQEDFAYNMNFYLKKLISLKSTIVDQFGKELYQIAENGIKDWKKAAESKQVSRGLWIAEKL
ncbi:MAG: class I SAM-dependent methyltransferase [Candidatus Hodarchaeales archaeon]|jgi:ubiquinone/menaquinone biosynthesis C-methylase UbiE